MSAPEKKPERGTYDAQVTSVVADRSISREFRPLEVEVEANVRGRRVTVTFPCRTGVAPRVGDSVRVTVEWTP